MDQAMEIQDYFDKCKALYESVISFLTNDDVLELELHEVFGNFPILNQEVELRKLLKFVSVISANYHRSSIFISRIEKIIIYFSDQIKQIFTNQEIFDIFKSNKLILLLLFGQKIITADQSILPFIYQESGKYMINNEEKDDDEEKDRNQFFYYSYYFFPEIKDLIDTNEAKLIESDLANTNLSNPDIFEEKRRKGENDNYICEMIRQDSVIPFIAYITKNTYPLNSFIKPSFFETNSFLIKNNPTLIEYAAFFGSIQIFRFLKNNDVKLTPSLWLYAIHGKNAEIIHLLEENYVYPPLNNYNICLKEAIKCHHNDIANYIYDNLIEKENFRTYIEKYTYGFQYVNYSFFPENIQDKYFFYFSCQFDYYTLVNLYLKYGNIDVNATIVQTSIQIKF